MQKQTSKQSKAKQSKQANELRVLSLPAWPVSYLGVGAVNFLAVFPERAEYVAPGLLHLCHQVPRPGEPCRV